MPRFTEWKRINWDALIWRLIATLCAAVSYAISQNQNPLACLKFWLAGALLYTAGFIENSERRDLPQEPLDKPEDTSDAPPDPPQPSKS